MNTKTTPPVNSAAPAPLAKAASGIHGLDEVLLGGFPRGRSTLVCGAAGSGKSLMAMEFLVRGATDHGEPGVFLTFEESAEDLAQNVASLGFDLHRLAAEDKLRVDYVHVPQATAHAAGEYDLEGLFIRLNLAIEAIGARRVVLDTVETLFAGLPNPAILRAELARLFRWLKDKGVTAIITGERGDGTLTRHGLEEYVSDCVIFLDHRVNEQISTRRLRVVKYRGSTHGTNEYPFLIDDQGISVLPVTSLGLKHKVSDSRVSSGVPRLDTMLGGQGYFRGSSILISGTAGTGKSSFAAHFVAAACARGERALYFAFEESPDQIVRNMASIGIRLAPLVEQNLLRIEATRPAMYGLETHLATMRRAVDRFLPAVVVVDPVNAFVKTNNDVDVRAMLMRLVDFLKGGGITALMTSLTSGEILETTDVQISSLVDTWLLLRDIELGGERNRGLYILKSRGMAHSNQIREYKLSDRGIDLVDVYVGPSGVLTGSARQAQVAADKAEQLRRQQEIARRQRELERKRQTLEAQIAALRMAFEADEAELNRLIDQEQSREAVLIQDRMDRAASRHADKE